MTARTGAHEDRKVLAATLVGTAIEWYDYFIYAQAAGLVLGPLFLGPIAKDNPGLAQLLSFATIGISFLFRPLGALVCGHLGDRIGRKAMLVLTLVLMGVSTAAIGLLPTYAQAGAVAPVLLILLRVLQGFSAGGEWGGAALMAVEHAPVKRRGLFGAFPQIGVPLGMILATLVLLLLDAILGKAQFAAWGWRVPFLLSAVMVILGLYVRLKLIETPAFTKVLESNEVAKLPIGRVFKKSWRPLILGTFIMLATYVLFYLMTTFTLKYGTQPTLTGAQAAAVKAGKPMTDAAAAAFVPGLGFSNSEFLWMLIAGVVFFGIFTLVAGPLAEKYGRRKMLLAVTAGILVFGLLFVPLFSGGFVGTMALLIIGFTLMGLTFGPMGALLPELFPTNVRYTGSAVSYNMSSILGAAVAPFIAVWLWESAKGSTVLVGVYLSAMAVLTLVALFLSRETKDSDYENNVA